MKKKIYLISSLLVLSMTTGSLNAQVCAIPTKDGTNSTVNGTVNTYWNPSNGTYNSASSNITLQNRRGASTNIAEGDLVLVIQMQCANINYADSAAYGDGVAGDTEFSSLVASGYSDPVSSCLAGRYEYVRAGSGSSSTSLNLSDNPLTHTYVQANATATTGRRTVQIVRVPQYNNATLSGRVTASRWNGLSGGIVALDVARTLNFSGQEIDVDGLGYRGGGGRIRSSNDANIRYRWDVDDRHASKGEGIAGTPRFVSNKRDPDTGARASITDLGASWGGYPNGTNSRGDFARGAPATAGGGGTFWNGASDNGGGGGGANGGKGGRGAAGWRSAGYGSILANYSNLAEKKWGFGGSVFSSASISRLVLGGGGGAGDNNNNSNSPEESSGAAGAGIVMIRARSIIGTGTISARGARAADNPLNDGAGGGGAGGSVVLVASDLSSATITINANGGKGADAWVSGTTAHGNGGGGGGGFVVRTGAATVNVNGGANGLTTTTDSPPDGANHGAKPGTIGSNTLISVPTDIPGINTGFRCLDFGDAPSSYGLADHNLGKSPGTLFLGSIRADGDPKALTGIAGIPSANADTDDVSDVDDEEGVTLPTTSSIDGTYTVATTAFNNTGNIANLCGWVDFDQDGIFQSDESVCTTLASSASSQSINLVFTVPVVDRQNTGTIIARFRITTDALTTATPTGSSSNGEVEDHMTTVTTLPVTINGFESHRLDDGLLVEWNTASETRNIGFYLWVDSGKKDGTGFIKLAENLIPSMANGALDPQEYTVKLPKKYSNYKSIAISAVDSNGEEELFGLYDIGTSYGRKNLPSEIDWQDINIKMSETIRNQQKKLSSHMNKVSTLKAQLKTNNYAMHRVSYEELADAGYDLQGVQVSSIALTLKGEPVARRIGSRALAKDVMYRDSFEPSLEVLIANSYGDAAVVNSGVFGAGMFIDFWATAPNFPDAEYLDFYTYELSVNEQLAVPVKLHQSNSLQTTNSFQQIFTVNEDKYYSFTNTSIDPWYAKKLRDYATEGEKSYQLDFNIEELAPSSDGLLSLELIGGVNFPSNPDHQVAIVFNDTTLLIHDFDGLDSINLDVPVPSAILQSGSNLVEVRLTSGTDATVDIVLVNKVKFSHPKKQTLSTGHLQIENQLINQNLSISNSNSLAIVAYASSESTDLKLLQHTIDSNNSVKVANDSVKTNYWVSTNEKLHRVSNVLTIVTDDLLSESADFFIIAHPAFMPNSNKQEHPLNRYIQHRQAQGWHIKTLSITDIQAQYTGGMALPDALTKFLKMANETFEFSHVLLVGSDSYDYMNRLGLQSISFIPTKYTATHFIPHTPSDQLLTDLDGDLISDKALGRWPVRTLTDLNSIVEKTIQWDNLNTLDAIFVADEQDGAHGSFGLQAERMVDLFTNYNWSQDDLIRIYTDDKDDSNGVSAFAQVRQEMFDSWENKKSLTSFFGHGSPTQWSRSGILNANDVDGLFNSNSPTLIGTLTCYTSYFVSPKTNTLSHRLLNGSDAIINGAVAVHGASTLSTFASNEFFAKEVLNQQLLGKTLGQAVLEARKKAKINGYKDQVFNWTLLGDPTILINAN